MAEIAAGERFFWRNMFAMPCRSCHIARVIKTWKSAAARRFAEQGKGRFPGLDVDKAMARLQLLDAVQSIGEIPSLASIGLHKLKGARRNQWAMTINGPWRLVFEFRDGDAYAVEIVAMIDQRGH